MTIDEVLVKIDNANNDDERIDLLILLLDTMHDNGINNIDGIKNIDVLIKYSYLMKEQRFIQKLFN